jgi:hypothetical protein
MELNGNKNKINQNMNRDNNITQLIYTYEELKGKTVMISLLEDDDDGGYDENKEYITINTKLDYLELELTVSDYDNMGILDEYYIVE